MKINYGSTGLLGSRIASFLSDIGHTIILGLEILLPSVIWLQYS